MYLLLHSNSLCIYDNCPKITNWPDNIDYKFLEEIFIYVIGTVNNPNIHYSVRLIQVHELINPMGLLIDHKVDYEFLQYIPKEYIKYCMPDWLEQERYKINAYYPDLKHLSQNVDRIYDEIMVKDIIE